jgi:hypothetical protein
MTNLHFLSKPGRLFATAHHWWWPLALVLVIAGFLATNYHAVRLHAAGPSTTFWLQTMDSCQQAIPGASFKLQGSKLHIAKGPGPGTGPVTVGSVNGNCPLQRGNCSAVPTGCLSWSIPVPARGSVTYKITETSAPANYVYCTGGSVCPGGPEVVTLTVSSTGATSAKVRNVYPDGTSVTWPTTGGAYTGTLTDPAVIHDFGLGNGSCDGDGDADDHLTGSPSVHCDSDKDHH